MFVVFGWGNTNVHFEFEDMYTGLLVYWVEWLPMARETWIQSQVGSYQRL